MSVPVLLITGPVGVGKTTIALEAASLLEEAALPHAVVDLDGLGWCYPAPADDRFNNRIALRNLALVWATYAAAGIPRLLIARVVEARSELEWFAEAVPGAAITVVRLRAADATLHARVARRETGLGRAWSLDRAIELSRMMESTPVEDHIVETDGRDVTAIAREALRRARWLD